MILIYFANFIVLFFITFTLTPRTNAILIYTELIWKSIFRVRDVYSAIFC